MPGLTHTTVYRTLEFLRRTGLVYGTSRRSGHMEYELAQNQHHHLTCRKCGREVELGDSVVNAVFRRLQLDTGFTIDHEHISLTGICTSCGANPSKK